jgi:arabinofuranosyltransferase
MLLVIPFYWLSGEIYYTAIALSMTVSLLAVWILCARFARSGRSALLAAFVLVCSKAFTDYSTSGLKNPLTHLLLATFYVVFLDRGQDRRAVFYLALLAALATVNRLDAIVLFAPPLAYALWSRRGRDAVMDCCLGFTPLALWELFSLLYYGFPFPNTAYAKLATGLPLPDRLSRVVDYLYNSLSIDPLTLAVIAVELISVLCRRDRAALSLAAGVALYLIYIIFIGGDFMSGRFLTAPFWGGILLLFRYVDLRRPVLWASVFCASGLAALLAPYTPFLSGAEYAPEQALEHRDERGIYYQNAGLLPSLRKEAGAPYPDHWWAVRSREVRRGNLHPEIMPGLEEGMFIALAADDSTVVAAWMNIGFSGFYAGPNVHIVDAIGLSDPLLARLPAREDPHAGAGHDSRIMPAGYLESVTTGVNQFADARLGAYYDVLLTVVQGDLLSLRRLVAIWKLNTGAFREWINWDFFRHPSPLELALSDARIEPDNPGNHMQTAWEYFKIDDERQAISALNKAIELYPTSFLNLVVIGQMLDAEGYRELAQRVYRKAVHNSGAYLQRLAAAGDRRGLLEAYDSLANIHIELGDPGFKHIVAGIYLEILVGDFPTADHSLYKRMGDFFTSVGMESESTTSYRKAGGQRQQGE